jgi:Ca-activated chloride channel family protein
MALLIFWWMLIVWLVALAGYLAVRYWLTNRRKRTHAATDTPVAHSTRLTSLPEYVRAFRQYRILTRWAAGALTLALLSAIILTARPAIISIISPVQKNRDIMLCLDASGSVLKVDTKLINRFSALVTNFQEQRFGLTLFNSSAVTVIPLNDNYQLTSSQLKATGQAFQAQKGDVFTQLTDGTLASFDSGTSLSSDGLASCVQHMGANSQQRSRSIILATDNEVNGKPVVGMTQAIQMALAQDIKVFVIDPGVRDNSKAGDHAQLKLVAAQTDGQYYMLNDDATVDDLIDAISQQQPQKFIGLPQPAINDNPQPFLLAAVLFTIVALVLLWRLEL